MTDKSNVIVGCETSTVVYYKYFFVLKNYNIHYNHSKINKTDSVIMYIRKEWSNVYKVETINNFKLLNCNIKIKENRRITITKVYRCHDYSKSDLVNIEIFLEHNKKNHIIASDFNIHVKNHNENSYDFLCTLLKHE